MRNPYANALRQLKRSQVRPPTRIGADFDRALSLVQKASGSPNPRQEAERIAGILNEQLHADWAKGLDGMIQRSQSISKGNL